MDDGDIIRNALQRLDTLESNFQQAIEIVQGTGATSRMYQAAVLALIASHPRKDLLRPAMDYFLEGTMRSILFDSLSESHMKAAQDAEMLLRRVLDEPQKPEPA